MITNRICLWSSPRSLSTGLMYSFAQREDIKVFDEPLFAHYAVQTGIPLGRGLKQWVSQMEKNGEKIIKDIFLGEHGKSTIFIKSGANQLVGLNKSFMQKTKNVLLIRDPVEIIHAYLKFLDMPNLTHIGITAVYDLYQELSELGLVTALITYKDLLMNPESMLQNLCDRLEIPFDENMLSWPAGPKPEDGRWAGIWYNSLHRSTGFKPYVEKEISLPDSVIPLAEECTPYYEYLYERALKP